MYSNSPSIILTFIVAIAAYVGAAALILVIFYWLVKKAIRMAMADHYKTVLIYEQTGEWVLGPHRKGPPPLRPDGTIDPGHTPPEQPPGNIFEK